MPVPEDLHDEAVYLLDGTLLPCWSWADHPELYSGKHQATGYNVQVALALAQGQFIVDTPVTVVT